MMWRAHVISDGELILGTPQVKILLGVNAGWRDDEQIPNYEGDGGR
jgi:hypothetical protein